MKFNMKNFPVRLGRGRTGEVAYLRELDEWAEGFEKELREQLGLAEHNMGFWKNEPNVKQVWISQVRTYKEILGEA